MMDFSRGTNAAAPFSSSLSPKEIISNLELFLRMEIDPENTLNFFLRTPIVRTSFNVDEVFLRGCARISCDRSGELTRRSD